MSKKYRKSLFIIYLLKLFSLIGTLFDYGLAKNKLRVLFMGTYSDNPRFLFEETVKDKEAKPLWIVKDYDSFCILKDKFNCPVLYKRTKLSFILSLTWQYLRSGIVIIRTRYHAWWARLLFRSSSRIVVNVSHGIPLKVTGILSKSSKKHPGRRSVEKILRNSIDFHIVSSKVERYILSSCYQVPPWKFPVVGYPRNDLLSADNVSSASRKIKNIPGADFSRESKIILYAPTHRGGSHSTEFFPFKDFDMELTQKVLKGLNAYILLRTHRVDLKYFRGGGDYGHRIFKCSFDEVRDINEILPAVDLLITDYSGIYIDFLLLNRPVIFTPYDYREYLKSRGGTLLNYNFVSAGPKIYTHKNFVEAITAAISGPDLYLEKRKFMRDLFHRYKDGNCARRAYGFLKEFQKSY